MNAILIFETIPEDCKIYHLLNISEDDENLLKKANGLIQNSSDMTDAENDAINCIMNAICTKEEYCYNENGNNKEWNMKWSSFEITLPLTISENTLIVKCGTYI